MNHYSMVFVFSEDYQNVLLLRKPLDHHNPLFRGRWTAPGGKQEQFESILSCAVREVQEETGLSYMYTQFRRVVEFDCNCDPNEGLHKVTVFGVRGSNSDLDQAQGSVSEPVREFKIGVRDGLGLVDIPDRELRLLWYTTPLLQLTLARMRQPA